MHLLVRETRSLDEEAAAEELGHTPAPLVALSFSDADLAALAAAWTPAHPPLRLAPLARLRHPLAVDLYAEQVLAQARCIVLRLLGGLDYWRYGAEEVAALARDRGIALVILPGDGADDGRLRELSTVSASAWDALDACFRAGGPDNMRLALDWAAHLGDRRRRPGRAARPGAAARRPPRSTSRHPALSPPWCSIAPTCSPPTSRRSRRWRTRCGHAASGSGCCSRPA